MQKQHLVTELNTHLDNIRQLFKTTLKTHIISALDRTLNSHQDEPPPVLYLWRSPQKIISLGQVTSICSYCLSWRIHLF